jgi:hypothetical protein
LSFQHGMRPWEISSKAVPAYAVAQADIGLGPTGAAEVFAKGAGLRQQRCSPSSAAQAA